MNQDTCHKGEIFGPSALWYVIFIENNYRWQRRTSKRSRWRDLGEFWLWNPQLFWFCLSQKHSCIQQT